MVNTHFDLISGPCWAPGALKGLNLAPKGPFWGPEVLSRAQVGQIWSQLHPNGLSIVCHLGLLGGIWGVKMAFWLVRGYSWIGSEPVHSR